MNKFTVTVGHGCLLVGSRPPALCDDSPHYAEPEGEKVGSEATGTHCAY